MLERADTVVLVIGTPIDEFMNPSVTVFDRVIDELTPHIRPHCLVVLRSTVFPGTTEGVQRRLHAAGIETEVVFCPERIAEGHALEEIRSLPQLVGASSRRRLRAGALVSSSRSGCRSCARRRWRPSWRSSSPTRGAT